ncbi:MAG TPA: YpdA family putative bacillithiol disulfide reductase [Gemmatimonadaceae bacterium]|jgi:thioredoxin reductase (NADPH)|nr:YpdA family putative bacillithiol disulfide reductase [Gemmatimonadaceae bacterium]
MPVVAVIGAGPCGLAAAIALQKAGVRPVIYDRGSVVSSVASYPLYMTFFSTAEKISIGGLPFVTGGEKPTRREALAYYRMVAQYYALPLRLYETVVSVRAEEDRFVVRSEPYGRPPVEEVYDALVIATGYFGTPNTLNVPGESLPHVTHLYREGHEAFQQDVVVVGGGNSAVDAALDLYRSGARVTVVHFMDKFDPNVKPWILPDMQNRVAEGSIGVRWKSRVTRIEPGSVMVSGPDGAEHRLAAQHVYIMTGFTPSGTLLRQVGVEIDEATGVPAHDGATMETNVPGVFIAGVLASGYDANKIFIENGRNHGERIIQRLSSLTHV